MTLEEFCNGDWSNYSMIDLLVLAAGLNYAQGCCDMLFIELPIICAFQNFYALYTAYLYAYSVPCTNWNVREVIEEVHCQRHC